MAHTWHDWIIKVGEKLFSSKKLVLVPKIEFDCGTKCKKETWVDEDKHIAIKR